MATEMQFDAIVVGAGIEGSSIAYQLAKSGQKTILLEQFELIHKHGSSHGQSRIIRKAYGEAVYTKMVKEAYTEWHDLEKQSGEQLFLPCDLVWTDNKGTAVRDIEKILCDNGIDHERFNCDKCTGMYPMMKYDDEDQEFVLDREAGILKPEKCLHVLQMLFKKLGGVIKDGEMVERIVPGDNTCVYTAKGHSYRAKTILLAAGNWTNHLLRPLGLNLPLQSQRTGVYYWKEKVPGHHQLGKMPLMVDSSTGKNTCTYAFPCMEYPHHVKLGYHMGPDVDLKWRDYVNDEKILKHLTRYVREHFPFLEDKPDMVETCIYTVTPDEHYILDRHPKYSNIIIAAGFSGHGFKLAPVIGQVLTEMALNKEPSYDLKMFKISRFDKVKSRL